MVPYNFKKKCLSPEIGFTLVHINMFLFKKIDSSFQGKVLMKSSTVDFTIPPE